MSDILSATRNAVRQSIRHAVARRYDAVGRHDDAEHVRAGRWDDRHDVRFEIAASERVIAAVLPVIMRSCADIAGGSAPGQRYAQSYDMDRYQEAANDEAASQANIAREIEGKILRRLKQAIALLPKDTTA